MRKFGTTLATFDLETRDFVIGFSLLSFVRSAEVTFGLADNSLG